MELSEYLKNLPNSGDTGVLMKEVTVPKGHQLYIPGQATNYMYEIISGAIKLGSYGTQGQEVTYDVICNPDTFGNLKYLNGQFFEFAESIVPSKLQAYRLDFFKRIIVQDPMVSEWFQKNIISRWARTESRLFHIRSMGRIEKMQTIFDDFNKDIFDSNGRKHNLFSLITM